MKGIAAGVLSQAWNPGFDFWKDPQGTNVM
jgi:hypothetical protein